MEQARCLETLKNKFKEESLLSKTENYIAGKYSFSVNAVISTPKILCFSCLLLGMLMTKRKNYKYSFELGMM